MAYTFSIDGTSFDDLDSSDGRKALEINPQAPKFARSHFHVPGVDGNFVVFEGREGQTLFCRFRYIGSQGTALGNYNSDSNAWAGKSVAIVDDTGRNYDRCYLQLMQRSSVMKGFGISKGFIDAVAIFTWEGSNN